MLTDSQREALNARLRRGRENPAGAAEIPRRPAGLTDLPASAGQEQLWFIDRFAPGEPTYNIPLALRLSGPLAAAALGRAIDELVVRHEALRTRLVPGADGRPVQVIDRAKASPLEVADLSGLDQERRQARLREFIDTEAMRPFSLPQGPLLRTWLLKLADDQHVLLVVVHHVVFDGWSAGVFCRELAALYRQQASGEPSGLAELPVQFADYAIWERDRLSAAGDSGLSGGSGPSGSGVPPGGTVSPQASTEYWQQVMDGYQTVQFPTDRPRPLIDSFEGGLAQHLTGLDLLDGLRELSRRERTTLFVTLMAGLQALLCRYTGQTDIVVGTVSANRTRPELASLIGFLVNTLPIRTDLSGDPTFTELLARVREATIGAYAHQDLPFGKLADSLHVERDPSRPPLFQIALTYAERDATPARAAGVDFVISDLVVGINAAKFDLDFLAEARSEGLWFECSYKTRLFDAGTVRRLLGHLEVLLRAVAADPSARLSKLPVLTGTELRAELEGWNDTAGQVPPICVHEGFQAQVARDPGAVAAQFESERWTYAELNRQANQIARRLRGLGVGPEVLVGVCMATGLPRLAALLGIWKAGGGYVPLDPALPAGRLSFMIADTGMAVLLADDSTMARLPPASDDVAVVCLDREREHIRATDGAEDRARDGTEDGTEDDADLTDVGVAPSNVAYVIYTSGSTGQPKGVVVEHRQAVNFLHGMIGHWKIGAADVVLQFASLSFDASVQEMFMPLLGGARVLLAPADTLHSPPRLAALMREARVTFACLTPSVASLLADEQFTDLRVLMCGGEEVPSELVRRWLRPGLSFVNDYGPTETTVTAVFMELDASTQLPPPIGRPSHPNYRAYVLDGDLNPVPAGVAGELHIGGAGVARGYLNRPELTMERFITDPFTPGGRLYKTGDLARRRPDGTLVFTGRIDSQVKIRGLRIELGEIEAALAAHPAIAQAVATVITDQAGQQQLAAYLRPAHGTMPATAEIRQYLASRLPGYMIPGYLISIDQIPLTTSGKIDKAALPAPQIAPAGQHREPPATLIETILVDLYATVLGLAQLGATDGFFDAGGNSLQAMRLISVLDNELGVDVGVAAVFLAPTPRQLAALLRDRHGLLDDELGPDGVDGIGQLGDERDAQVASVE